MTFERAVNIALKTLESAGLDSFELFTVEKERFLADAKEGEIESLDEAVDVGISIRVLHKHRLGFSYTTSINERSVRDAVWKAVEGSKGVDPDEVWRFAVCEEIHPFDWVHADTTFGKVPAVKRCDVAKRLEAAALSFDSRVKKVRKAEYEEMRVRRRLINSNGVDLKFENTLYSGHIIAVAESNGDSEWAWDIGFSHEFDRLNAEDIGKRAASRAISLLGARPLPTKKDAACLHPYVSSQLLTVLVKGFYGDNIFKKKSILIAEMGRKKYSDHLTIVNDTLMEGGYASAPFDGEGGPAKRTPLVKNGVISNWLTDGYWADKLGVAPTSSSVRESIKAPPSIGISNLYIEPSGVAEEDLFSEMNSGFFITGIAGAHTINSITGEFSVGAEGKWIEGGRVSYPVKGVMIAGNIHNLFSSVTGVASNLKFIGCVGSPTIMVPELQVSGE